MSVQLHVSSPNSKSLPMRAYACHAVEEVERSHKAAFIQPPAELQAATVPRWGEKDRSDLLAALHRPTLVAAGQHQQGQAGREEDHAEQGPETRIGDTRIEQIGAGQAEHRGGDTDSGRWTRIEDSWVVEQRVGWCAMSRGGEPWRGLLII